MFVWIHLLHEPDLRVTFQDFEKAHEFGKLALTMTCEYPILNYDCYCSEIVLHRDDRASVGQSSNMQVTIQNDDHTPEEGWDYWCPFGINDVTEESAAYILQGMEPVES
jgi:hypothetical protein